ncbi:MAG: Fic family protein [Chitinophagaceae bacterium]|nr:MAG: Fic family protein [Chitinophagaceae bacterium]
MKIHTLEFMPPNWMQLTQELSQLDRFDAQWQAIERREQKTLKELKSIATVRSIGASTRIEGSQLSDNEVEVLIENLDINKLTERDQQEVAGYYETLNLISESYRDIAIAESSIRHLHNTLMKYSTKDGYHRGNYKINTNRVERTEADGSKTIIFETTAPGWATEEAMRGLVEWYNNDASTHPLIRAALFVYEFLSIHPFQDGNGRLSRLLATLLLMKSGYVWIEYVSFEHEIEHRKKEYYKKLMDTQRVRPGEDVTEWVYFFLDCLKNIQQQLLQKLREKESREAVGVREQRIYQLVDLNPGISSGDIAKRLNIPSPTVKRILADLVANRNLVMHGAGRGTRYSIAVADTVRHDLTIRLTNDERSKEFTLRQQGSFLRIKKIVLVPLFEWKHPDEWSKRLLTNGLYVKIKAITPNDSTFEKGYSIATFNHPSYFQPVFIVHPNIMLPEIFHTAGMPRITYPVKGSIELLGAPLQFDFDVMLVTDER